MIQTSQGSGNIFRVCDGMEVDMLFDIDERILRFCVVGKPEPRKEAKIWKFRLNNESHLCFLAEFCFLMKLYTVSPIQ